MFSWNSLTKSSATNQPAPPPTIKVPAKPVSYFPSFLSFGSTTANTENAAAANLKAAENAAAARATANKEAANLKAAENARAQGVNVPGNGARGGSRRRRKSVRRKKRFV